MKHVLLIFPVLFFWVNTSLAQCPTCTPDTACAVNSAVGGFCYDLPFGVNNQSYLGKISMRVPENLLLAPVQSLVIDTIIGLPAGLDYTCSNAGCIYEPGNGDTLGCISVCGTPNDAPGWYRILTQFTVTIDVFGFPVELPPTADTSLFILSGCEGGDSCVWPGDANNSGLANIFDILNVGIAFGETGPSRQDTSILWYGRSAADWPDTFANGANYHHADGNGDGVVDFIDVIPIILNYGLTHNKTGPSPIPATPMDPPLFIDAPDSLPTGTAATIPIILGTNSLQANDVYGLAFRLNYDKTLIDSASVDIDFSPSWLGIPDVTLVQGQRDFYSLSFIDAGMARNDQLSLSSDGQIGTVSFVTIDNLDGVPFDLLELEFENVEVIDEFQQPIAVNISGDTIVVYQVNTGYIEPGLESRIEIFPNPSHGLFYLDWPQSWNVQEMEILDVSGRQVYLKGDPQHRDWYDLNYLHNGTHILRLHSEYAGTIHRKIMILE